ncbi:helix-turn-helix domain-containing protein [Bacteroides xylanisolvens]|uniref:helix-turn-helix domain-containing protein n=1 Tax=Bacteroides xylanisolvens TaxID=371601 RepID=UPI002307CC71|nr:helix-turn-helix domain-containing protein [Bacteroides xylanisolvens]MDB0716761.1 helix-turn-helix domain-containing protein [Bacteroides xylanisolvens]MDB0735477.1 helix-turn-helix domain-containing protein [Bacteroides xylanisolvens]
MEISSISIRQFKRQISAQTTCYRNDIIISNHVERLEPFHYPCRIFATLVLFCLEGEMDFSINLKRYRIGSNTMVVAFDGDIIQIHHVKALEAYAILLSSDYLNDLQINFRQRSNFYIHTRHNAIARIPHPELMDIVSYYPLLKTSMEKKRAESPEILRGLVQAFSYTVISVMQVYCKNDNDAKVNPIPRNQQLFDKFMALLKLHYTAERGVKFYANRLCLTPNYLSSAIKEYSGRSAMEWINDYVILEAKIMLRNTNLSIQEIACRLNFATQSAFGKYFKLQTGMGPKFYRDRKSDEIEK